ncbi:MFS transporter [Altericista sp. CCNU0014]|uniref:MFS transporter n=1 Tax=Altericista sp. CCNU0014 TaxID=3082949 RepID=UPI00384B893F
MSKPLSATWRDPVLCFLLVAGSLTVMAGAVMAPILPELIAHLHLSRGWAGSLVSVHYLTLAIFSPILGVIADRHGQMRVLIPCLLGYAVVGASGAFLPDYFTLLVARGLLGVASGGIAASSLGLLSRRYEGEARHQAIAYAATAITLANIVYPLLAVGLGYFNWRLAFGLYGVSAAMAAIAPLLFRAGARSRAPRPKNAATDGIQIGPLLSSPASLRIFISLMMVSAIVYGTIVYLPIYLKTVLGSGLIWNGFILAIQAVGAAFSSGLLLRAFTRRVGSLGVVGLSLGTMALFLTLFPHLTDLSALMLVSGLFGVSFGLVTPSLYNLLANLAPDRLQSSILATGIGAGFLGQFVSPLILGGILSATGIPSVFYSCAAAAIALGLSLLIPLRPQPAPATENVTPVENVTHVR